MKIAIGKGLLILVSFSLLLSIFASVGTIGDVQASGPTYVTHSPIRITSNNDLAALKALNECTGTGTVSDPYVISGYDISGIGGACIYVADITKRLVITNNHLHGNYYGIEVTRSKYVVITNNDCSGNDPYGIYLHYTSNDTLTNNLLIDAAHSIYAYASNDNIMDNNTCRATRACAIMLDGASNRNIISNNTCYSSGDNGIYILHSDYNTLSNNTITNNYGHGIHLADSNYNKLFGNEMIGNNRSTSVYSSLHPQGADTGIDNHWNTGSYGNYWSDWTTPDTNGDGIVDNAYPIAEGSSKDNYPLASPGTTVPGVPTGLTAVAGDGQVGLTWSAPSSNGGIPIDYYIVYQDGADAKHVTTTSTTISGLTNGHSYSFKVAAHNIKGLGGQTIGTSSIPYTVPNTPTGLTVLPGNAQVDLNWIAPTISGGATIDYYIVYQDGADAKHVTTTSTTISGLTNGRSYSFAVAAHNSAGISAQTAAVSTTPLTVPGVPTGLTAINGNGQVSLNWTVPSSNGGAAIDYYIIHQDGIALPHHISGLTTVITGLINGQTYSFTVSAHNLAGSGPQSTAVNAKPSPAPTVPGAPTGLIAIPENAQVSLSWIAPTNNGGVPIDYYIVYRGGIDVAHPTMNSKMILDLANGQSYTFTVAAHNSVGTGPQCNPVLTIPLTIPGTPNGLLATPGDGNISLSWSPPSSNGGVSIDYYVLYQNGTDVAHPTSTNIIVAGVMNGVSYTFNVAAHNPAGTGLRTSGVSATPNPTPTVPPSPTGLIATPGNAQITLSWTSPNNNGGAAIDYYIVYQDGVEISHSTTASNIATGLTNGQSYNFTVAAHNAVGSGMQTSAVTATPIANVIVPGIPTNLIVTPGNNMVALSWMAPSGSSDIDYYIVYLNGTDVNHTYVTSATITGLTNGENYSFAVAAHNSGGVGNQSPTQTVSPSATISDGGQSSGYDDMIYLSGVLVILAATIVVAFLVVRNVQKKER